MFRFATPLAFLLLIPWGFALWRLFRRGSRSALLYAPMHRLPERTAGWRSVAARLMPVLFAIGTLLLIIAAARPQTFFARERRTVDALAIAMVVDVSGSMEALDLTEGSPTGPNSQTRLDVVKSVFARFIKQRPDDLIALIAFGGYASTRSPLTADHAALLKILEATSIPQNSVDEHGRTVSQEELLTAIGDGLATACARLQDAEPKTRIVVLLSDGESNTGIITPETAAALNRMMQQVVRAGTGTAAALAGIPVAGKTGTAETGRSTNQAWFIAFAPADAPRVAVAVTIEDTAATGGEVAAPLAAAVLRVALEQGRLP